jgi:hypothetical protein
MIYGKITSCEKLRMWNKDFKGSIRKFKNRDYFVGAYEYIEDKNIIHITELPPWYHSDAYCKGSDSATIKKDGENRKGGIESDELVLDIEDNTTLEGVDIMIYLKPEAYSIITSEDSKYGNNVFDPFEHYFELTQPIYNRINLVNEKGEVVEYKSYESVFDDWFRFRKELYEIRVEREKILVDLEIQMLKNIQRFSEKHDEYGITKNTKDEEAIIILSKEKYKKFNHRLIESPRFTNIKDLIRLITVEDASYDYILELSYRDLTESAYLKRQKRIEELQERLLYLSDDKGMFKGAVIWLKELDELEKAINDGINSNWFYGENEYTFE